MPSKPDIWMPLYIGDYLAATAHLDALESGAYLHLLMHQWKNERLPSEPDGLRRIAKVERDAWSNAWVLLEPFFDHSQGFPVQLRLEKIREEWKCKQLKAKEKAKNAADARWGKYAPRNTQELLGPSPSPISSPSPLNTNTKPLIIPESITPDTPKNSEVLRVYQAYPHKVGKGAAVKAIGKAFESLRIRNEPDPENFILERIKGWIDKRERDRAAGKFVPEYPNPTTWFNQCRYDDEDNLPKPKKEWHVLTEEESAAQWEKDFEMTG